MFRRLRNSLMRAFSNLAFLYPKAALRGQLNNFNCILASAFSQYFPQIRSNTNAPQSSLHSHLDILLIDSTALQKCQFLDS